MAEDYFGSGGIFSITVYSGLSLFLILMAAGFAWEIYKKKAKEQKKHCGPSGESILLKLGGFFVCFLLMKGAE